MPLGIPNENSLNGRKKGHENVKKWTSKIDLFAKKYIVIPMNESSSPLLLLANVVRAHWFVTVICNLDKAKPREEDPPTPTKMRTRSSQPDPSDTEDGDVLEIPVPKARSPTPLSDGQINRGISEMSLAEAEYDFRSDPSISADDKREMEAVRTGGERRKSRDLISLDDDAPSTSITALLKAKYAASSPVPETVPSPVSDKVPDKEKRAGRRTSRNPIPVNEPVIIVFDSLGLTHPNVFKALREYVVDEAREKRKMDLDPRDLHGVCAKVPIQSNYADCGVYLLHYVQRFLHEPGRYLPDILVPKTPPLPCLCTWVCGANEENRSQDLVEGGSDALWASAEVKNKRSEIRDIIHHLADEQELAKTKAAEQIAKQKAEEHARKMVEEEAKKKKNPLGVFSVLMRSKKQAPGAVPNDKTNPEVID